MHGKIFQVSMKPIKRNEYFSDNRYYNYWDFVPRIADYVDGGVSEENARACIRWLGNENGIETDDRNRTVRVTDKHKYFADKFDGLIKAMNELRGITLDEFCSGKRSLNFTNLNYYINDEFGFYIDSKEDDLMTFDEWVRSVKEGETYHIGAVIDYHF